MDLSLFACALWEPRYPSSVKRFCSSFQSVQRPSPDFNFSGLKRSFLTWNKSKKSWHKSAFGFRIYQSQNCFPRPYLKPQSSESYIITCFWQVLVEICSKTYSFAGFWRLWADLQRAELSYLGSTIWYGRIRFSTPKPWKACPFTRKCRNTNQIVVLCTRNIFSIVLHRNNIIIRYFGTRSRVSQRAPSSKVVNFHPTFDASRGVVDFPKYIFLKSSQRVLSKNI